MLSRRCPNAVFGPWYVAPQSIRALLKGRVAEPDWNRFLVSALKSERWPMTRATPERVGYKSWVRRSLVAAQTEEKHKREGLAAYQWFRALGSILVGHALLCQIYNILHQLRQSVVRTSLEILGKRDHGTEIQSTFWNTEAGEVTVNIYKGSLGFRTVCSNDTHKCLGRAAWRGRYRVTYPSSPHLLSEKCF